MGHDVISFGTDGWRATLDTFTDERVRTVGRAVAGHLRDEGADGPVVVGYDARPTSAGFAASLADVLTDAGFDVRLPTRDCPTPVVAWAVVDGDAAGALMVTASHNPPEYNGVKFVPADGAPALPDVTDAIEARLGDAGPSDVDGAPGTVERFDPVPGHATHVADLVDADLTGVTVVYDAMHGSGRGVADALLESAGATVVRRRCDRDPDFGGTAPEPTEANLGGLVDAVATHDADLGIATDGDADRVAVVTPDRGVVDENRLFAVVYDYLLESERGPAVRTVSTTFLVDRVAEAHGESVVETPVGFKWVAAAMADHDALVGGEASGGFSIRGHVRQNDGVMMALLVAGIAADGGLDGRIDDVLAAHGNVVTRQANVDCPDDAKADVLAGLEAAIPDAVAGRDVAEVVTLDGVKLLLADGSWLLVRPSGTEPTMRVYAEAERDGAAESVLDAGVALVDSLVADRR